MRKFKVYLAGKMSDLSFEEMNGWREKATSLLTQYHPSVHVENPCDYYNPKMERSFYTDKEVKEFDLWLIRNCDVILANLSYSDSIGTAVELNFAHEWKIPVIAFGTAINHPWVELSITKRCETLEDAVDHILAFYSPNVC